jgi:hypothetical protein
VARWVWGGQVAVGVVILLGMDAANDAQRVSDAEREAVVARLSAATGEGRLTLAEFGERAGQAYAARTRGELVRLVDDLPAARAGAPVPVGDERPRRVSRVTPIGSVKREGRWRLDRDTEVGTVVGSVKLDLRRAEIAAPEVELRVRTVVGSVKVWVPRGVTVEVEGASFLGSRQVHEDSAGGFGEAPVLRLRVDTVVGSVKVYRT